MLRHITETRDWVERVVIGLKLCPFAPAPAIKGLIRYATSDAKTPEALNVPGFDFHGLQGKPKRYSVHVNGPWCIIFEWQGENAVKLDFENYQ